MTTFHIIASAALAIATGLAVPAAQAQNAVLEGLTRNDLLKQDFSIPGREVVQVLVEFAPGVTAARHSHPGDELVYVVEGSLEYALDGKSPVTVKAGQSLLIPYGTPHAVKNVGSGKAAELATYIVEKGKPLLTLSE